ncbi:MAG: 16S rRNA (cytosine(1402)-N(4))-methyltransferase RsmH [Acidimicrobiales bacterium]
MSWSPGLGHIPVMEAEVVELLAGGDLPGPILDATLGGGGHAAAILEAQPQARVLGLDRDPDAVEAARGRLWKYGDRARVVKSSFADLREVVAQQEAWSGTPLLGGALFDLGVSSWQLDRAERGFSYRAEGPLDMRMDTTQPFSAADVVNEWSVSELAELFAEHGEVRFARRIAGAIVAARPLSTTTELAEVVRNAIPAATRRHGGHPARRTFQALRVAVNGELDVLVPALEDALDLLAPGGRLVVLAYHSLEDRAVKNTMRRAVTGGCTCPPALPCVCGAVPRARLLTRGARRPSAAEVAANHRADSARLRAVEKAAA